MKKMILMAGAILSAAIVNAAAVTWGATDIQVAKEGDSVANYIAYLVLDQDAADVTKAINEGKLTDMASASSSITPGSGRTKSKIDATATTTKTPADGEFSGYLVIFNAGTEGAADKYMMSSMSAKVSESTSTADFNFGQQTSNTWQPTGVPEPTSALLLVLGMAGLALKRKVA